jgi:hypothetical protein
MPKYDVSFIWTVEVGIHGYTTIVADTPEEAKRLLLAGDFDDEVQDDFHYECMGYCGEEKEDIDIEEAVPEPPKVDYSKRAVRAPGTRREVGI